MARTCQCLLAQGDVERDNRAGINLVVAVTNADKVLPATADNGVVAGSIILDRAGKTSGGRTAGGAVGNVEATVDQFISHNVGGNNVRTRTGSDLVVATVELIKGDGRNGSGEGACNGERAVHTGDRRAGYSGRDGSIVDGDAIAGERRAGDNGT